MREQLFGCNYCWPSDATAAWQARATLTLANELIDDSHFIVTILGCKTCGQRYISVFTEMIDWQNGNDPQYWTLLPITDLEAESLIQLQATLDKMNLNALGLDRRSLQRDHPKVGPMRVFWGNGISVGPHD